MTEPNSRRGPILRLPLFGLLFLIIATSVAARPRSGGPNLQASPTPAPTKKSVGQDDAIFATPAKDLLLRAEGEHKADALAHFVEGMSLEENGEMDKAQRPIAKCSMSIRGKRIWPLGSRSSLPDRMIFRRQSTF